MRISEGKIVLVGEAYLDDFTSRIVAFWKIKKESGNSFYVLNDIPNKISRNILAKSGEWGFPELKGVISAPTLRDDYSVLSTLGYDPQTGLFLTEGAYPDIPLNPTRRQIGQAWEALWKPFRYFPFETADSRGVMVAAILTAVVRHLFPTAPGFMFDATAARTGKTKLAMCIQVICGMAPSAQAWPGDDAEVRKQLLASLIEGKPAILYDNIKGEIKSGGLEAFITTPVFGDRLLGTSTNLSLPTRVMMLLSSNNACLTGDLFGRILKCRIDAKVDNPERRSFDFEPVKYCIEHRHDIVAAALTMLRGYISAGMPRDPYAGTGIGSFEAWELIRQTVLWLQREGIPPLSASLGDPIKCVEITKAMDPDQQSLRAFLESVYECKINLCKISLFQHSIGL